MSANSTALRSEASTGELALRVELPPRRWILAVALTVLIAASTAWVANSPVFRMRDLRVTGAKHLSEADVARLAGLSPETNVLWVSGAAIAQRLEQSPWVASATVVRHLPAGITVAIRERTPVARVSESAGRYLLIAADGTILGSHAGTAGAAPELRPAHPTTGPVRPGAAVAGVRAALQAVAALPSTVRGQVTTATERADGTVVLSLERGTVVEFGDASRAAEKGRVLKALLVWSVGHGVSPHTINVEAPTAPAIVPE